MANEISLLDPTFNGIPGSNMYRAQVFPELYPHEDRMLIENWHQEDLEAYCGGVFTPGYIYKDVPRRIMQGVE